MSVLTAVADELSCCSTPLAIPRPRPNAGSTTPAGLPARPITCPIGRRANLDNMILAMMVVWFLLEGRERADARARLEVGELLSLPCLTVATGTSPPPSTLTIVSQISHLSICIWSKPSSSSSSGFRRGQTPIPDRPSFLGAREFQAHLLFLPPGPNPPP